MVNRIKSLASDTMIYGIFTVVGRFITFLLTPIYTNFLTITEVGDVINLFVIFAFMMIVYSFGMETAFFRFFKKNNLEETKKAYSISFSFITVLSFLVTFLILIFSESIAPSLIQHDNGAYIICISALVPLLDALMLVPYAVLRLERNAKKFASIRFILILVSVSLNLLFVIHYNMGIEGILWGQIIANFVGVLIFLPQIIKHFSLKCDQILFIEMLKFGLPTLPANLAAIFLQLADRPILMALKGSEEVAMYGINYRLGIPMMLFVSVFEYAWKPFYLSRFEDKDAKQLFSRVMTYFTFACAIVFLITALFMELIVQVPFVGGKFINPAYWEGMGIIPIILLAYFLYGAFLNFACGFHIVKQTKYLPLAVGSSAIINIAINFLFIPIYGYWAAAIATLVAYLVSATIIYLFSQKIYPIKYDWARILQIIASAGVLYLIVQFLSQDSDLTFKFIIKFAGIAMFFVVLYFLKFFTESEIRAMKQILRSFSKKEQANKH